MRHHRKHQPHPSLTTAVLLSALGAAAAGAAEEPGQDAPSDSQIRSALIDAMLISPRVFAGNVEVSVKDGTATLSGTVESLLARRRAAHLASLTRGVQVVDNRLQVRKGALSDTELRHDIIVALDNDPAAESYEILVSVEDGVATLKGNVGSWQEREMAGFAAMGVRGLRDVVNQITVTRDADRVDTDIRNDVVTAIEMDPYLEADSLRVSVTDGVVSIAGAVGSLYEKEVLRSNAWTTGVRKVDLEDVRISWLLEDDELRHGEFADESIAAAIRYRIGLDPLIADDGITLTVEDGTAWLYGTVDTIRDRDAAERAARRVRGVMRIKNYLTVVPGRSVSDEELEKQVDAAIDRDPWLNSERIAVTATNGHVYLDGQVDSTWERRHAREIAGRVEGIIDIHNWLQTSKGVTASTYGFDYGPFYGYDYLDPIPDSTGSPALSDWEIREDIRDELFWSPFVDSDQITVAVDDGVATLTGSVEDWDEYRAARANAFEGGATAVVSGDLTVGSTE